MAIPIDSIPPPFNCGRRLLSHLIDERARSRHERPFASIPVNNSVSEGYRDVSYQEFANAIDRLATWITINVGAPAFDCEPIVYLAGADLRYQILCLAAVKTGFIILLVSPRNSAEAFASLLQESAAQRLLVDERPLPSVSLLTKTQVLQTYTIPSLLELLDGPPVPPINLDVTWEEYRFRPFVQIHTSGSTGLPKLITLKHGSFTAYDAYQLFMPNELAHRLGNQRVFVSFPAFHVAGLAYGLAVPCWVDSTVVLPPPAPLTADLINEIHLRASVEYSALAPSLVTDLTKNPTYYENLSRLNSLLSSGGPLAEATGRRVIQQTALHSGLGASEWMAAPMRPKQQEDWQYFCFNTEESGLEFRERDKGLFEMCIVRKSEADIAQPVFVTIPDIDEFCSKDLFSRHPSKPDLWKYVSRLDDVIVFSNGEKLNPVTFEGLVSASPLVKGCVVVGQGRFQAALLIEPASYEMDDFLVKVWPSVEQANGPTVKHGRIAKDHLLLTLPAKPLPRAGKGTIQRSAANKLYASEIDDLYTRLQDGRAETSYRFDDLVLRLGDLDEIAASLTSYLSRELDVDDLGSSEDFFSLGMDSLQLINLVRAINAARPQAPVDAKLIYDNSSVEQLSLAVQRGSTERHAFNNDSDDEELKSSWLAMDKMYGEMTKNSTSSKRRRRQNPAKWLKSEDTGPVVQPDGGTRAWLQVLSMVLVNINNWGLVNSFGVFQTYYQSSLLSDHSASSIAWIGSLQGALLLIVGVVSGPLFDKGYFKSTLVVGSVGLVFALMMLSISSKYYEIMLSQGVLLGICEGLLYTPSIALVPVYFKKNRGFALGLSTAGGPLGGVIYPTILYRLLPHVGFGWAVRILGFVALATLSCAVILSKPLGPRSVRQLIDRSAFRDVSYLTFMAAGFFITAGTFTPFFLATAYSEEALHTDMSLAFSVTSILNAAQLFGRWLPAWSADYRHQHFGPETVQFAGEVILGILGFCWIAVTNVSGYIPWVIFFGFFSGFGLTLPAVVLPHICPNASVYGTRLGMLYACGGLGLLISTPVAAAANSATKGFLGSQLWTGATGIAASLFFGFTAVEARKRRLLYEMGKRDRRLFDRMRPGKRR